MMVNPLSEIDLVVRGVTAGALFSIAAGPWRHGVGWSERLATALLCIGAAAWDLSSSPMLWAALSHPYGLLLPAFAAVGFLWLFVVVLFEDRKISPLALTPAVVLASLSILAGLTPPPADQAVWDARDLVAAFIAVHAAVIILRSWRGDLVGARRRLRGLLLVAVTAFIVTEAFIGMALRLGLSGRLFFATGSGLVGACFLAVFSLAGVVIFVEGRFSLFPGGRYTFRGSAALAFDGADSIALERLKRLMEKDEAWRREGLTIGAVAEAVGIPEYRLRRLINDHLGHRNFADFLNAYRITAAKVRLAEPELMHVTIASIAFDLGYGSLGPFNRAFKADTGATPTEWQRRKLGQT